MSAEPVPLAREVVRGPLPGDPADVVALDHDGRQLRRRRLVTRGGLAFLADLAQVTALDAGDALVLEDGRLIGVVAAEEDLMAVTGDLVRLAWHIGNRHAPCQIGPEGLVIRRDHVLRAMLTGLGAEVRDLRAPFLPEGGAYGTGRVMGHSHGHSHGHGDGSDLLAGLGRHEG
jgi:urease accessory protein